MEEFIMKIELLDNDVYKGKKLLFKYKTEYFYDIETKENENSFGFYLVKKPFNKTIEKQFEDILLSDWLENPMLFGAIEDGMIVGYLELSHEQWNNRMRISNILIEEAYRGHGIGKALMEKAYSTAVEKKARMLILETQACNYNAISFYRSCGLSIIGFDLFAYTNQDIEGKEFRIEMGKIIV